MEPVRQPVRHGQHAGAEHGDEPEPAVDGAVVDDARRDGGVVALVDLVETPEEEEQAKEDEEDDDADVGPVVRAAAPLQGEDETDDGREEEEGAEGVEFDDLFAPGGRLACEAVGAEEEDDGGGGDTAEGQIDVETPSPGDVGCKDAAQYRAEDASHAEDCSYESHPHWSLRERRDGYHDGDAAVLDAGRADAADGASPDECNRVGRDAIDETTEFEHANAEEKDPFDVVESVNLAHEELEGAGGHQVRRAVPADVPEGVEVVGEGGEGDANDGPVERYEEDGEIDSRHDGERFPKGRHWRDGGGVGEGMLDVVVRCGRRYVTFGLFDVMCGVCGRG